MTNSLHNNICNDLIVETMKKDPVLWHCLHSGNVSVRTIGQNLINEHITAFKERNIRLLEKLASMYGSSAVIARKNEKIIGHIRFYPKIIMESVRYRPFCLQAPNDDFDYLSFPKFEYISEKTIYVHCLMISGESGNAYRRKGIASEMVNFLIKWAKEAGWKRIEANAYADLPALYAVTSTAGKRFWEKRGFHLSDTRTEPVFTGENDFIDINALRNEAKEHNIDIEDIPKKYIMALDL